MKRPVLLRAPGLTVEEIVNGHLPKQRDGLEAERILPPRYGRGPSPAIGFVLLVLAAFAVVAVLYGLILGLEAIGATRESVQATPAWRWGRM